MNEEPSNREQTDEMLVQRILAGDRAAEFELCTCWRPRLIALARSILHDGDLAEDAAQLALLRMYHHLDRYDKSRPFGAWILKIAGNVARDLRRKPQPRPPGGTPKPTPPCETNRVDRDEERAALRECVDGLRDRSRTVVALFMADFSLRDCGKLLQSPKSTVQGWLKEAMDQLQRCMAGRGFA